uniref:non-specific serine/threonine protein kinase n=1 Tax=viral metagenome TaxID=1070528 RepID=A0A6C0AV14_9ZZZZ|tara:strand:- start:1551 stop:2870 length:1320 start_codon:yes stop_codon:yes gene_type:complete
MSKKPPPDLQITGVSAPRNDLRAPPRATTPVEQTSRDFFLKLIENTVWSNNKIEMKTMLDSAKIIDKNVYNFLKNKNGLEWLKIYQNIEKNNDSQPNKLNLVRYLNKKGCSYYSWLYFTNISKEMYNILKNYIWMNSLGKGGFAEAHLLKNTENGYKTVIKLQKHCKSQIPRERIISEIKILSSICHKNVIKMKNYGISSSRVWIELEYADLGTLDKLLLSYSQKMIAMSTNGILNCWSDILSGLEYLHSINIIHRDIKCENIFIFSFGSGAIFKLGDFNLSRINSSTSNYATSYCGTMCTMAPEVIGNEPYTNKIDIWSFLCVGLRILLLKPINPLSISTDELEIRLSNCNKVSNCAEDLRNFMLYIHHLDPATRPSAQECKETVEVLKYKFKSDNDDSNSNNESEYWSHKNKPSSIKAGPNEFVFGTNSGPTNIPNI